MTEMVYGTAPVRVEDPILPRWWRTIDKMTLTSVLLLMAVGILLGMAASPPLAQRNGVEPFYYVERQVLFGGSGDYRDAVDFDGFAGADTQTGHDRLSADLDFADPAAVLRHRFRQGGGALV